MSVLYVRDIVVPPSLAHVYSTGDYNHALACFQEASDWADATGASTLPGLRAQIIPPHHAECPWYEKIAPWDLQSDPGWSVTVNFFCSTEAALDWLKRQPAPENARVVFPQQHTIGPALTVPMLSLTR